MSISATFQMKHGDGTVIRCETVRVRDGSLSPYPVLYLRQYGQDRVTQAHHHNQVEIIADVASLAALRDELNRYFAHADATLPGSRPVPAEACT